MKLIKELIMMMALLLISVMLSSCIDENIKNCPPDLTVHYTVASEDLKDFSGIINMMALNFYISDSSLWHNDFVKKIGSNEYSYYTNRLKEEFYRHIFVVNCENDDNNVISNLAGRACQVSLSYPSYPDTVNAGCSELYSGVVDFKLIKDITEVIEAKFKPCNAGINLKVNYPDTVTSVKCYVTGTANGYLCQDDLYMFNDSKTVMFKQHKKSSSCSLFGVEAGEYIFPSKIDGEWIIYLYAVFPARTVQYKIEPKVPLTAGRILNFDFVIDGNANIVSNIDLDITVDYQWGPGSGYDVDID